MPASLRFVLLLLGLGILSAPVAFALIHEQDVHQARVTAEQITHGDSAAGRIAIARYGCGSCHEIEGIDGAHGKVGPPLAGLASRTEIAGRLPNQPDQLIFWLRHPQAIEPGNGMPDQGIGEQDARNIAAYLYTLRKSS